jgi:S-DNA-T family DNA segregation ATPase FtsK/SpoIIIE
MTYQQQQLALVAKIPRDSTSTVDPDTLTALTAALSEFAIRVEIVNSWAGPQLETVSLRTRQGERLVNLRAALPDIALRLGVRQIGLNQEVGDHQVTIAIPCATPTTVSLSDVLFLDNDNTLPASYEAVLPWTIGVSSAGKRIIADLTEAPHVLISAEAEIDKSSALAALILGLSMTVRPEELEFILVDPRGAHLEDFLDLPHVRRNVIASALEAENLFAYLRGMVAERYKTMQAAGVSDIADCLDDEHQERRIVVVIDELADLMTASNGDAIEDHVCALARNARPVGIHLVCATQHPSSAILSKRLRLELPTRLTFGVATAADSLVAIDDVGAEALIQNGDGLLRWASGTPVRLQGVSFAPDWVPWLVNETLDKTCAGWESPGMDSLTPKAPTNVMAAATAGSSVMSMDPVAAAPLSAPVKPAQQRYVGYVETPLSNEQLLKKGMTAMWWMERLGSWGWIVPAFFM